MTEYLWIKFRAKYSSGPSEWRWDEIVTDRGVSDDETAREYLSTLEWSEPWNYNTESEHWRGWDWYFGKPPENVVMDRISSLDDQVLALKDEVARLYKYWKDTNWDD